MQSIDSLALHLHLLLLLLLLPALRNLHCWISACAQLPLPAARCSWTVLQTLARGITKTGVAVEMADLLSVDPQELVELMARNSGIVIMAPPSDNADGRKAMATMLSAIKAKQKVGGGCAIVQRRRGRGEGAGYTLFPLACQLNLSRHPPALAFCFAS